MFYGVGVYDSISLRSLRFDPVTTAVVITAGLGAGAVASGGKFDPMFGTTGLRNKIMGDPNAAARSAEERATQQAAALKQAQDTASSQGAASVAARRARYASSQTIFTNPLGIAGSANIARKVLLGQ